jgi:aldose 1-epimerase
MAEIAMIELGAGRLKAEIAPSIGGSIARFSGSWSKPNDGAGGEVHWLRPATTEALSRGDPLSMGSFPLLPFCNRIRDGRASFEGREIHFPPNHPKVSSPHPLHGIGWQRPWQVMETSATRAVLTLQVPPSAAWPWRFSARQEFTLTEARLEVGISLTNEDGAAMPAGIGHHPYFPHTPGTRLTTGTAAMWQADDEVMPTMLGVSDAVRLLRSGVQVSELDLDNNFTGWERSALIEWPADQNGPSRSLTMQAEAPLDYFVLYCPQGFDHFCAEPVSQCTDWLNLLSLYGKGPLGGARLAPGETLPARFSLTPHWD